MLKRATRALLPEQVVHQVETMPLRDEGHGVDRFGLSREGALRGLALTHALYTHYFRVQSFGAEHIPADGGAIVACNHSGMIPLDAVLVTHDLLRKTSRVPRVAVDWFVPGLPWVNLLYARAGTFSGSRGNFHAMLDAGELVLVFPEGVPGISKRFSQRYQLQTWRQGHAELAIHHQVPIVPAAVVGAEEQWPQVARVEGVKLFGAPFLPVPATPLPMPVKIRIRYGEPIPIPSLYPRHAARDADAVKEAAARVREAVEGLLRKGLAERKGVFL